ncbi:hypothetical protein LX16_2449 [Stackebrandtia albiflava]|uniref:Secreted protein n=1 Tax=Stackebrandtia albiflava TaxID=406432 RepID=A0A562V1N8_9ACTN|nr:hypothetical protein [Stackebrandtia albiflava]TWJ11722.1 hypothetical protein LX16_2449 [Stackebrandtia albiflava]
MKVPTLKRVAAAITSSAFAVAVVIGGVLVSSADETAAVPASPTDHEWHQADHEWHGQQEALPADHEWH